MVRRHPLRQIVGGTREPEQTLIVVERFSMCPAEIPDQSFRFTLLSLPIGRSHHGVEMCSIHEAANVGNPLATETPSIVARVEGLVEMIATAPVGP